MAKIAIFEKNGCFLGTLYFVNQSSYETGITPHFNNNDLFLSVFLISHGLNPTQMAKTAIKQSSCFAKMADF